MKNNFLAVQHERDRNFRHGIPPNDDSPPDVTDLDENMYNSIATQVGILRRFISTRSTPYPQPLISLWKSRMERGLLISQNKTQKLKFLFVKCSLRLKGCKFFSKRATFLGATIFRPALVFFGLVEDECL